MNGRIRIGKEEFGLLDGINRLMTVFRHINNVWPTKLLIGSTLLGALKEMTYISASEKESGITMIQDRLNLNIIEVEEPNYLWVS